MDETKYRDFLKIDKTNLVYEMKRHPSWLYRLGVQAQTLQGQMDKLEHLYKVKKAKTAKLYREKYKSVKISEARLEELTTSHPSVIKAYDDYLEMKDLYNLSRIRYSSALSKGEMMINIAHTVRKEMDASLVGEAKKQRAIEKGNSYNKETEDHE